MEASTGADSRAGGDADERILGAAGDEFEDKRRCGRRVR